MPECEKWNMEPTFRHEEKEPTVYELAEMELQAEQKYIIKDMMQEKYYDYFWDEKHAL
jgi:hypothetical protein